MIVTRAWVSDANVISWRPVEFGGGSGRGTAEDWLESGCWPDAAEAPQIAVVGSYAYLARGGRSVALPSTDGGVLTDAGDTAVRPECAWPGGGVTEWRTWPESWHCCGDGARLLAACSVMVPTRWLVLAAVACCRDVLRLAVKGDDRPGAALDAAEAWASGAPGEPELRGFERLASRSLEDAMRFPLSLDGHAAVGAHRAVCHAVRAAHAPVFASHAAAQAADALYSAGCAAGDGSIVRAKARIADVVRGALPWHVVLERLAAG